VELTKNSFGFSLMEILIAVGILASATGVILSGTATSVQINNDNQKTLKAVTLAVNKMTEIEDEIDLDIEKSAFPDDTKKSGKFDEPYTDFSWNYEIRKVEIPLSNDSSGQNAVVAGVMQNVMKELSKSVRELKLTVTWGEKDEEQNYTLTTHIVKLE
jgi:type II secretory pathway pseudopilin PulG